jgi:hypothetical protein
LASPSSPRGLNAERLIREVEKRLEDLPADARAEVLDALREEFARERRRADPMDKIEAERARRIEAETLREILEAINRQARLQDTIDEVLKQLSRIVVFDSCRLALLEPDGQFRILAARGVPDPELLVGTVYRDALSDEIRETRWPISVTDVEADERLSRVQTLAGVRSWAGIPLLVEGEVIGLLSLSRHCVDAFQEEDLHRAKAVAFSAAAAIRKARLLEQVRRYAALMERTVAVDQAVFQGRSPAELLRIILEGAVHLGAYPGGLLVLAEPGPPHVAVAVGDVFADLPAQAGGAAPPVLDSREVRRLQLSETPSLALALGAPLPEVPVYLVPLATSDRHLGTLALLDPNGDTADDRLMEAYASRAATAYLYATEAGLKGRPG